MDRRNEVTFKLECTCKPISCTEYALDEDTEDPPTPLTEFFWIPPVTPVMVEEAEYASILAHDGSFSEKEWW
jgi:hypothetical protein